MVYYRAVGPQNQLSKNSKDRLGTEFAHHGKIRMPRDHDIQKTLAVRKFWQIHEACIRKGYVRTRLVAKTDHPIPIIQQASQ
jgi:hypothetical protein